MEKGNTYTHLTLEERQIILKEITNGSTKITIAHTIGKTSLPLVKKSRHTAF